MKKITEITPDQASRFPEWVKKWTDIGLSTDPADFEKAEIAALKAYELIGLKKPMVVLRVGSPLSATISGAMAWCFLRSLFQVRAQVGDQVRDQVWDQVGDQVWDQVRAQVGDQVWDQVRAQVGDQVWDQVWDQVRAQVGDQVWDQVGDQVWDQVWAQVGDQVGTQVWDQVRVRAQIKNALYNARGGSFWASWVSQISFIRDVLGWSGSSLGRFEIDEELTKTCGWVWWHERVLVISDRPKEIHRDDNGRLHSHNGPSISYPDGWSLYHSHGTSIPEEWIKKPETLTPRLALGQSNAELRRAGCEILGWDLILSELGAHVIDTDSDPEIGQLVEIDIPDSGRERFLRVKCGTGRQFALPVPPTMQTALEANAWTYDIPVDLMQQKETRT
jgi:hypothetical protein